MRFHILFLILISGLYIMTTTSCKVKNETYDRPVARKIPEKLTIHGDTRTDNYYWLNQRNNPEVTEYLEKENQYLKNKLKHTEKLQDSLFEEITERIKPDDMSVPYKDNGYYYYERYEKQKEHPIYCRKKDNMNAEEEILLDVNILAEGYPYYHVSGFSVSPDNKYIAYGADTTGRRKYEIIFKNIKTGETLPDKIPDTDGEPVWANDNKTVFYVKKDKNTLREYQIKKHIINTPSREDKTVYTEEDEAFYVYLSKSKSDRYITAASISTLSSEYGILDADKPESNFKTVIQRSSKHEYHIEPHGKDLFILTNAGNSENFKIIKTSISNPDIQNAEIILPHKKDVFIEDFEVFKNFIAVTERYNGLTRLRIINLSDKTGKILNCGEDTYDIWLSDNDEFETNILRYGYSSLTTPVSYYDYNMKTGEKKLLKQKFAGKNFDKNNYKSERLYAKASDGTEIPISLVYRKGIKLNGKNPLLIYGYGSYGYSIDANFRPSVLSLLDRGFIYAVAHVRGGQELGRKWYDEGKLFHKKNTFTDFIACTEFLQKKGYSSPRYTFAEGGSAGGLLMGVIANTRPDLYAGIVAEVPFVDVVTTMLDETVPLTAGEYDEWGNPGNKKYYEYMLSYSPYDNVKKQKYPAMLITAGLNDSQVQYWEPAKWTAKLREYNTSENNIFLFTNMDAGHGGMSGRYKAYKETALIYAFLLDVLNKNKE